MTTGQRLAAVQYDGHLAIDAIYQPLVTSVSALVMHYAILKDGVARLVLEVVPLIRAGIARLIMSIEPALATTIVGAAREAERVADPVGRTDETSLALAGFTAMTSLRRAEPMIVSQVGALLLRGVAMDFPAREVARTVAQYVSPWFATRRDATGELVRDGRVGVIASWPGQAGMASARARLLMLYETTRAHSRGMVRRGRRDDLWLAWRVSAGHAEADECDDMAHRGPYRADDAPAPPRHPRCRCFLEPTDPPARARARS
jgi:hypothetical protein